MSLSFSVSFTLFSALVSVLCVFCLIDSPTGVEMFHPSLSSFSLHFSSHHSLRHLWRLRLKSKWERQNWGEPWSAKDGKGKSLLLRQRTLLGSGQEKWAVEMGALRPSEMFCSVFLPPLTMWMAPEMFFLFVAYFSISVSTSSLALNKFLTVCLSLLSLKLLSYCCLRPKILLPWHTICTSHEINVCSSSKTIHWSKSILDKTSMV